MIEKLEYKGKLIHECSIEGETRGEGFFPGHINAAQLSRNRFMLLYSTRGWRGGDDNCSIIYQIRDGAYDGPLVSEGRLAESIRDWDALDDGRLYVKSHVHPLGFGLPKGAKIGGKAPAHSGLFTIIWNRYARYVDPETGLMPVGKDFYGRKSVSDATRAVQWTQLRLNESEDGFDVVQPVRTFRQKGYGSGYAFCEEDVRAAIMTFTSPVPFNDDASEWIGSSTFSVQSSHRIAALKFAYNPEKDLYEWTRTGPVSADGLFESSVLPYRDSWIITSRVWANWHIDKGGPVAWMITKKPFEEIPEPVLPGEPRSRSPSTAFLCADGQVRMLTNDRNLSPYNHPRNPLFMWDIDPESEFSPGSRRTVFDSVELGMPIRNEAFPVVDQAKIFPHAGGNSQIVGHRLRTFAVKDTAYSGLAPNDREMEAAGIYYSKIQYDREYPGLWSFD